MVRRMLAAGAVLVAAVGAHADVQRIAPGTGRQDATVVDTGANGLCETAAAPRDLQAANLGQGARNRTAVRCGPNRDADTAAAGDDVQLVAVGGACQNGNTAVVDTGENGIPETAPAGDDTFAPGIALGVPPANAPCVVAGPDGIAQTAAPAGDDVQLIPAGRAESNTDVLRCGPNRIADSTANNVAAGDDVQLVPRGGACAPNEAVVDSGADGIASTRAEGPDLRIELARPLRLTIARKRTSAARRLKFLVRNVEFGSAAPAARSYRIGTTRGSCPAGAVTQVDADARAGGLQPSASVPRGKKAKAALLVTVAIDDVTTLDKANPFRCAFDVSAVALDTDPDLDDAANDETNTTRVVLEILDKNDL